MHQINKLSEMSSFERFIFFVIALSIVGNPLYVGVGGLLLGSNTFSLTVLLSLLPSAVLLVSCFVKKLPIRLKKAEVFVVLIWCFFWGAYLIFFVFDPPWKTATPVKFFHAYSLIFIIAPTVLIFKWIDAKWIQPVLFLSGILLTTLSLLALILYVSGNVRLHGGRINFTHGLDALRLARYAGLGVILNSFLLLIEFRCASLARIAFWVISIICCVGAFLLGNSRGPMVSLLVSLLFGLLFCWKHWTLRLPNLRLLKARYFFSAKLILITIVISGATFFDSATKVAIIKDRMINFDLSGDSLAGRLAYYYSYLRDFQNSPFYGAGYTDKFWAHNIVLEALGVGGLLLGLPLVLLAIVIGFKSFSPTGRILQRVCLFTCFIYTFTGSLFSGGIATEYMPWLWGALLFMDALSRERFELSSN